MAKLSKKVLMAIEKELNYWRIPGASIAIIKDGMVWDTIGIGYRNIEQNLKATADTQFGIASCSKSMTSALIAVLVDKGILKYDEPVTTYAPELVLYDPASKDMTLRDILSHKTGFGCHDAIWPGERSREELAKSLKFIKPCTGFRQEAIYSNVMYAMAGYVAECASGEAWDDLMQKYTFTPLGMTGTNCSVNDMEKDNDYALPYRYRNGSLNPLKLWNLDLAGPAASINSTANDMAKWLMMHIKGGKTENGTTLIEHETFKEMHSAQSQFEDSIGMGQGFYECNDYSMGWRLGKYKEHEFYKHTGKIEGFSSIQAFLPQEGAGVAILTNLHSPTAPFMYGVLYTILDEILGEETDNWFEKFHGEELPKEEDYHDCQVNYINEEQILGTKPSLSLNEYVGTYYDEGYGTLNFVLNNNTLYMKYRDMNLPLKHYHYDVFYSDNILADILTVTAPVKFIIKSGKPEAVAVRFEPMVDDIIFNR